MKRLVGILAAAILLVSSLAVYAESPRNVAVLSPAAPTPSVSYNFLTMAQKGALDSRITCTRSTTATDSIYTDAAGSSYNTYAIDQPRLIAGRGILLEPARTNRLLNSATPATQTTASLPTGTYTLWVIGTGSATSSAGTATGSGFGTATAGVPNIITLTGAGTVTVTVTGSLNRFQLEAGDSPSSFIVTAGSVVTRAADFCNTTYPTGQTVTLFAQALPTVTGPVSVRQIATLNSSNTSRFGLRVSGSTTYPTMSMAGGTGATDGGDGGSITAMTVFKAAIAATGTQYLQVKDRGPLLSGAMTIAAGNTTLTFASSNASNGSSWNGYLQVVSVWQYALPVSQFTALTR